jgi:sugar lactone lactonase YvrE
MIDTPSGVAVDKTGNVYVSLREGTRGVIRKYTPDGIESFSADIGEAVIYGLAVAANGDVYVAMATGPDQGVYRVDRTGTAELLPGTWQIVFPNGLAFDSRGNLYVTESYSGSPPAYGPGGIWRIPRGGEAELWMRDPLLTGRGVLGPPVGANGIGYYHGDLYVTNTDKGLIVRIPVATDGNAGVPEVWKQLEEVPESPLKGSPFPILPDGLVLDVHGNVYVTILTRNAVVAVRAEDRAQESIAVLGSAGPVPSAPFDTPASLAFGTGAGEQQHLFVTNLGWMIRFIPQPPSPWPGPALVKVPAGVPGRPLH